jgi:hypothetical protein
MEEITDFDKWLQTVVIEPVVYYAIYDLHTGAVIGVYPHHAATNIENKILIDTELAESIFSGNISLSSCFVDEVDDTLSIVQTQIVKKIDDILHRISDQQFVPNKNADLYVTFNSESDSISISLSTNTKNKKIKWAGETQLKFFITEYNDPHKVIQIVTTTLNDLYTNDQTYRYIGSDKNFSVFTSRIFKNYIFEKQ